MTDNFVPLSELFEDPEVQEDDTTNDAPFNYPLARSNRFRVKDVDSLISDLKSAGIGVSIDWDVPSDMVIESYDDESIGVFAPAGEWPDPWIDSNLSGAEDVHQVISRHLVDGDVAIMMEIGNPENGSLFPNVVAINSQGKDQTIFFSEIYHEAMRAGLGENITEIIS